MRLAWLTDIHLNFVPVEERKRLYASILEARSDGVLLSGDIADSAKVCDGLLEMKRSIDVPIYFVLGNHDFYHSSVEDVRMRVKSLVAAESNLTWLTDAGVQFMGGETAVIGDDGWADGRLGDYYNSRVMLNDYVLIADFLGKTPIGRLTLLNRFADEAAERMKAKLSDACALRRRVILVTHVPPFREACVYDGKISSDEWLPHFSSKAMGEAVVEVMDGHPETELVVLCGHTHGAGVAQIRPNVLVKTGGAEYGRPRVQEVFELK